MEIKGLKKNIQDEKRVQDSPKARPSEFTPVKLDFFSSNLLKKVITHLSEMSLSPSLIRLNRRREHNPRHQWENRER